MTTGLKTTPYEPAPRRRRGWLVSVLAAALWLSGSGAWAQAAAASFDLTALMAQLAQRKSGEARFTEERTVSSFDYPLRSSGRLSFEAPDRFSRFTEEPRPESMEVQGNEVLLKRGNRTRQMALDSIPELSALADAMRGTLTGDAQALRRHFKAQVSGNGQRWVLLLTPIDARLARSVQQLEIAGTGADMRSIELRLAGGDRSLMLVEPLAASAAPR